jgi:hypothetical protein
MNRRRCRSSAARPCEDATPPAPALCAFSCEAPYASIASSLATTEVVRRLHQGERHRGYAAVAVPRMPPPPIGGEVHRRGTPVAARLRIAVVPPVARIDRLGTHSVHTFAHRQRRMQRATVHSSRVGSSKRRFGSSFSAGNGVPKLNVAGSSPVSRFQPKCLGTQAMRS